MGGRGSSSFSGHYIANKDSFFHRTDTMFQKITGKKAESIISQKPDYRSSSGSK